MSIEYMPFGCVAIIKLHYIKSVPSLREKFLPRRGAKSNLRREICVFCEAWCAGNTCRIVKRHNKAGAQISRLKSKIFLLAAVR